MHEDGNFIVLNSNMATMHRFCAVFPRKMTDAGRHISDNRSRLTVSAVAWPSGLRRWFKAPVSTEAWVRIPPLPTIIFRKGGEKNEKPFYFLIQIIMRKLNCF